MRTNPAARGILAITLASLFLATSLLAQIAPTITSQPTNVVGGIGGSATFNVEVSGTGPFSYQWIFNGAPAKLNNFITTVAGNGTQGYSGDGGAATNATLDPSAAYGIYPTGIAVDSAGNFFFADYDDHVIRKIGTDGIITTVAGNGTAGYSGDGGSATNATLNGPLGVAVDAQGDLFYADFNSDVVRKVSTNGIITTIVGTGNAGGFFDAGEGVATNFSIYSPIGLGVDSDGNVFFSDYTEYVRKVKTNGLIAPVAGNGNQQQYGNGDGGAAINAALDAPFGVAVDTAGDVFFSEHATYDVREVGTNGIINMAAGDWEYNYTASGVQATNAALNNPLGVAVDKTGNFFIADEQDNVIRKVGTNGIITTVAGNWNQGFSGDGGAATNASLNLPCGVAVDASGDLFILDQNNYRIRKVTVSNLGLTNEGATLVLSDVAPANAGSYYVVVSNAYGSVTSSVASLTLPVAPAITAQPASVLTGAGGSASLSVGVSGEGPFTYQWYFNDAPADINDTIITVAGNGSYGYAGDGGAATSTSLYFPLAAVVDGSGNLFISDFGNSRIRKVGNDGIITTIAGNGDFAFSGDGGAATNAALNHAAGIALDASGNLFIADAYNNRIREVAANGVITTVAGDDNFGYSGDGGAATNAPLYLPTGIAVDASGNLFIADADNNRIREVGTNGIITTVAGNGTLGYSGDGGAATNASLNIPFSVAVDVSGDLFIADSGNRVRKVANGIITTVAGNGSQGYSGDGGAATNASLHLAGVITNLSQYLPSAVAVDSAGNLFIADTYNDCVRKVGTNGIITTVAGDGTAGFSGDGGAPTNASLYNPTGVTVDGTGNVFIADTYNNRIRQVVASDLTLAFGGANLELSKVTANNVGDYYVKVASAYGSVTSSVASLGLAGVWPQAISISLTNGGITLSYGGAPSSNYIIAYTTNLAPPIVWIPLATNPTDASGNVVVVDTNIIGISGKFYRVSSP